MNRARAWWIAIFILAALVGLSAAWLPAPLDATAPETSFAAARAYQHIQSIAKAPHPTGSPENARVREYLIRKMHDLGLNPREMKGAPNGVAIVNLYGELAAAQKSAPPILLVAHYDSTPNGPGAADDSTGVAVALETIRALQARGPLRNTIGLLLTDGEEVGDICHGANFFVHHETNLMQGLRVIVNLEARGNHGPVLMFQTGANNNGLIQLYGAACPLPVAASFSEDIYRRMPNDTDLSEFLKAGKRGYNFAFTGGIEFYHSAQDTPENLSQRTLQHYGACVLPLLAKLGAADDQTLQKCLQPGDATFFTLCRGLLARYPASLAKIFVLITAALFAVVLIRRLVQSQITIKGLLASFAVTFLAILIASAIGLAAVFALARIFKPRIFGPFMVGIPLSSIILLILLLITAALTFLLRASLLGNFNPSETIAGTVAIFVILAITTNVLLPGAAYLFQWPAFFAALALITKPRAFKTLLTAAPAPLLLAPTILLIHQTITIGIAPISAALIALAISLEAQGRES